MAVTGFFSSFETGDPQPADRALRTGPGPDRSPTARPGAGFTGLRALRYPGPGRWVLFEVDVPVGPDTELSYVVFPVSDAGPAYPTYRSTHVAVEAELDDGRAAARKAPKELYLDQWNLVRVRLGEHTGHRVRRLVLTVDPPGDGPARGWLDDVRIADRPVAERDPVDHVRTTRGSHSSGEFSRGNTFPATAVPNGFNFWTPVTDASSTSWLYEYHRRNNAGNLPALEALALSHQPSPWMGDRHTFQVMPGTGPVTADRRARALPFRHANETDLPHHYGVRFDNGVTADIAPTDHAAVLRFGFPGGHGWVLFDNVRRSGGLRLDPDTGTIAGHTWVRSRLSTGARRMYVHGTFDRPAVRGRKLGRVTGYLGFDAPEVTLRVATSLIGLAQAKRNLAQEIPPGTGFDEVRERARAAWQGLLGRVEIEGATEDQRTTFYSNLYRLFLYPNSGHERTREGIRHASPVIRRRRPSTRRRTGAKVVDGPMSVNHGFWDTYRTCWPAYALLAPERCGRLIDGFVQQYREGGWIARWSSPGYADLMTGTSSDVAFADAWLKGVRGFDVDAAYQAALRNATVAPTRRGTGRKGLHESIFLGYTPTSTREGLSWALEGSVNDFGLANLAEALGHRDDAAYFRHRAAQHVHHFDPRTGFYQGRNRDGSWHHEPAAFDPTAWGGDYTETDAWNTAFSAPHDGPGLAALHGGTASLESKLDTLFATPETGRNPGAYGGIIHEMTEARDIRLGQYGHSNQPSHHIPYVYLHAGAPAKTQAIVREVLSRLYLGGDIGQGYPGDEDNGEMSAWYVLSALGLYPLAVGSPEYAVGSPLFRRATLHLGNGRTLVVNAPGNTATTVYVHDLRVNGEPHPAPTIPHALIAEGGVLDFTLGTTPSRWGTGHARAEMPSPLTDLAGDVHADDGTEVAALVDDTSRTEARFRTSRPTVRFTVHGDPRPVEIYTLTSGTRRGDPHAWTLEGSDDGVEWTVLDTRHGETFRWRRQTRPFTLARPARHARYRLRITAADRRLSLAQWELLATSR